MPAPCECPATTIFDQSGSFDDASTRNARTLAKFGELRLELWNARFHFGNIAAST
jgi:hypothetical protein